MGDEAPRVGDQHHSDGRADVARRMGRTETEVEALTLLASSHLSPLARPPHVLDPDEHRREVGRLIAEDVARLRAEQDLLSADLRAYEELWERADPAQRGGLEADAGKRLAARAAAFRERLADWEMAARELCRIVDLPTPPGAASSG